MKTKKPKLNPNARKWVRALRSGKFKQCKARLSKVGKDGPRYCCLGVACEVFIKSGGSLVKSEPYEDGTVQYAGAQGFLPGKVCSWLGLQDTGGEIDGGPSLASRNDKGVKFTTIANLIESQPEGLFRQ